MPTEFVTTQITKTKDADVGQTMYQFRLKYVTLSWNSEPASWSHHATMNKTCFCFSVSFLTGFFPFGSIMCSSKSHLTSHLALYSGQNFIFLNTFIICFYVQKIVITLLQLPNRLNGWLTLTTRETSLFDFCKTLKYPSFHSVSSEYVKGKCQAGS